MTLQRLGTAFGASFVSLWAIPAAAPAIAPADPQGPDRNIDDSARGELEGFPIIKARDEHRRPQAATQFAPWLSGIDAFLSDSASPTMTGLALAQVYWGAEAVAPIDDRQVDPFVFRQLFTDPATGLLTLHGHHVQAEGLQFKLNSGRLEAVVDAEMAALQADPKLKQARLAQMARYRFESRAPAFGFNGYIAQRGALLVASGATHSVRLAELRRLMRLWSPARAAAWFETIRREQLHQHPLLTQARVAQVGAAFADSRAKALLEDVVASLDEEAELRRFLRAAVAHSLAIRLRQSFVQLSGADERQIALHVRLPLQFDADIDDIVTVCETVGLGDGATRAFIDHLEDASGHWRDGFIESCPNAEEDAALERFFLTPERHVAWRSVNPDDIEAHRAIAVELGGDGDRGLPAIVRRVLFDAEAVGDDQVEIYELARDVRALRTGLSDQLGREATAWELASAAVDAARASPQTLLGRILSAYAAVPDAEMSESFSPEARLADQVYRLSARLCADGCQACLHHPSDLMSSSLTEASVSRNLLRRFVAT